MKYSLLTSLSVGFLLPTTVWAHALWIEEDCPTGRESTCNVSVYFGEYNEGLRETKDTRLLERKAAKAFIATEKGRESLPVTLENNRFKGAAAAKDTVLVTDEEGDVVDLTAYGIGIVRPFFYARYHSPATKASTEILPLDIRVESEPKVNRDVHLKVTFNNAPLPKTKVDITAPNGWSVTKTTDADGTLTFKPLWDGLYVAEVTLKEGNPGEFKGKSYEANRRRATLSLVVPK